MTDLENCFVKAKEKINKSEILFYHLEEYIEDNKKEYSLIRVKVFDNWKREKYHNGRWYPIQYFKSYYRNQCPGIFINEKEAVEIMILIDHQKQKQLYNKK
ncbi:hypothetical protein [Aquimarina sp. AU58]|uniref:hypothetical protein n=1 Tax=Aquimarina sp. AU58 TaxID=1874112 RepID=UPI000D6DCA08|nr:hypothetical protein [Aquimarina sp. AU58]